MTGADITERQRVQEAEQDLRRAHAQLEARVQERTAELAHVNEALRLKILEGQHAVEALARRTGELRAQQLAALNLAQDAEEARKLAEQSRSALAQTNQELEREIAERKRMAEALREREWRLSRLAEAGVIGIMEVDTGGHVLEANDTFLQMVGYSREELRAGKLRWDEMTPAEYRPLDDRAVAQLRETGIASPWEKEYVRKDGTRMAILVGVALLPGTRDRCIAFALDITERKRAQETVVRQAAELARSNADLEQFAYVASHDLQEPLRMIASYLELLVKRYQGKLDAKADRWIGFAVDSANRMKDLINDLLEFSHVTIRGKPFARIDCVQVFNAAVANLQQAIKESAAVVTHGTLPALQADATQLTQLFQNLISNAIKYRRAQAPEVRVEAVRQERHWRFSVRDNGIGIDPQFQQRIFVIFQRLHTRAEYPGTGIGLTLCKKIIERHGGRIWVESQPGLGATFFFTIPDRKEVPDGAGQTR
jgi:PAS domain S-box-containing protein